MSRLVWEFYRNVTCCLIFLLYCVVRLCGVTICRDLKLENFLFEGESLSSPLILIDFGLSKHFDSTERMSQRVGSCYYTGGSYIDACMD